MNIVSIDIGLRNFSLSKEHYDLSSISKKSIPIKTKRYEKDGSATEEMRNFVQQVALCGDVQYLDKQDLGDKKEYFSGRSFQNLYKWLSNLKEDNVWDDTDVVLIEQQMKTNYIATTLMHHLYAWLLIHYPTKTILLYPSKNKTRILGMALKVEHKTTGKLVRVTKYQRKRWSIEQMKEIIQKRKDDWSYQYIFVENKSKRDDLTDILIQALSYIVLSLL
jgi:hypothetical protein